MYTIPKSNLLYVLVYIDQEKLFLSFVLYTDHTNIWYKYTLCTYFIFVNYNISKDLKPPRRCHNLLIACWLLIIHLCTIRLC